MGVSIPDWSRRLRAQLSQLALHLSLHVEGLLAAADPALVPRLHELPHLFPESVVADRSRPGRERLHLGLDVQRWLATGLAPGRFRLHQLADLLLGLRSCGGRV